MNYAKLGRTGLDVSRICLGCMSYGGIRRPGAGRKRTISKDPTLLPDLETLVEPTTRGDPEPPLRWTCKSVRRLAQALQEQGHEVSRTLVAELLNCRLQSARQPQDHRGRQPSRPGCAVWLHKHPSDRGFGRKAAGDLRRYQEEGAGWGFPQQWTRVSPARQSGRGPGP